MATGGLINPRVCSPGCLNVRMGCTRETVMHSAPRHHGAFFTKNCDIGGFAHFVRPTARGVQEMVVPTDLCDG
jgi:hypothetical protein